MTDHVLQISNARKRFGSTQALNVASFVLQRGECQALLGPNGAGKTNVVTLVGIVQVTLMFLWGAVVFGLDLWTANHLSGFAAMTVLTAASASALGILLATVCRSQAQLDGVSITVILIMSALGGSMVPRAFMPKFIDTVGLLTFNGWAIDGYLKVFWYDNPKSGITANLLRLWPQLAVLAVLTAVFLVLARRLARRWEFV